MNDIVGTGEIAERAGVTVQAIHKWMERYSDFPQPTRLSPRSWIWLWSEVRGWLIKTGRMEENEGLPPVSE